MSPFVDKKKHKKHRAFDNKNGSLQRKSVKLWMKMHTNYLIFNVRKRHFNKVSFRYTQRTAMGKKM